MKKVLFVVLAMALVACGADASAEQKWIKGSGKTARGAFDISLDYTSLSVSSGIKVILEPSPSGEGTISADENLLEFVSITEENGRVKVSYEPNISIRQNRIPTIVTMPLSNRISRLSATSSADIVCEEVLRAPVLDIRGTSSADMDIRVEVGKLNVELSSSADCRVSGEAKEADLRATSSADLNGNLVVGRVEAEVTSSGGIRLVGSADVLDVEASSSGDFRGFDFVSQRVDADASSAAAIEVTAIESLDAEASSGADVRYKGTPARINRSQSSGGSVRQIN